MEKIGKYAFAAVLIASAVILVFVGPCGTSGTPATNQAGSVPTAVRQVPNRVFTPAELSKYNGRNGQPAYVAVDGWVYDMTGSRFWVNGVHGVCEEDSTAGQDLSEAMREAPPGMRKMLLRFPLVGQMKGNKSKPPPVAAAQSVPQKTFTAAELAKYDGKNGHRAYVAADSLVYDVTGSPFWVNGMHSMCNVSSTAGRDLTAALKQAPPSMRGMLQRFPVVGRLQ